MLENYEIDKLKPKKNPYVTGKKDNDDNYIEHKDYRAYMKCDATEKECDIMQKLEKSRTSVENGNIKSADSVIALEKMTVTEVTED